MEKHSGILFKLKLATKPTRGAAGAKELLGEDMWGIIGTDHYAGYHWLELRQRQLCWAHVKREFLAISERAGEAGRLGLAL